MIRPLFHIVLASTFLHFAAFSVAENTTTRNVILIIGDGMDEQQITIARNYLAGSSGQLLLDTMPLRAQVQVLAIEDRVNGNPVYVSDSANTATAMATGVVTSRGRIATAAGTNTPLTTLVELADEAGFRSGLVTTARVTDATPAAFAVHMSSRRCEDPDTMTDVSIYGFEIADCSAELKANGGSGSISEQLITSPLDLLLGGGRQHFEVTAEGEEITVEALAVDNGFVVVDHLQQLLQAKPGEKLLGLFAQGNLPVRLRGEDGRQAEAPVRSWLNYLNDYLGSAQLPAPMNCEPNPDFDGTPTLVQMTEAALTHLSHDNDKGFFLMVESASIDKQAHERKPCGSIGEMAQLEEVLASALRFASRNPNTLIIVTSDHSQVAQLVPDQSLFADYPVPVFTPGKIARIKTPEGSLMAVNYATNGFIMGEHTGAAVPLFSNIEGVGRISPFLQQPDIFRIIRGYLNL